MILLQSHRILLLLVLLVSMGRVVRSSHWWVANDEADIPIATPVPLAVQCLDSDDLYELLYSICLTDPVCAYLYSLDWHHHHRRQLFYHQMALFDIFGTPPPLPVPWHGHFNSSSAGLWLEGRWPANITVSYDSGGTSCYNLTGLADDTQRALFNYVALDRLKTHKQYYSRLVCPHHNQRLLYDPQIHGFQCQCLEDKQCDDASWHDTVILILAGLVVGLFVLICLIGLILGLRLIAMLKKVSTAKEARVTGQPLK